MNMEKSRRQLIDRLTENYADYRAELLLKDRQELIDGADRIAKTAEVFQYFTQRQPTEQEVAYFLQFQNPLEVAADHWESCEFELDALPEKEYNYETIPGLKHHYGDILDTRNEADDESVVQGALRREHDRRERMPKGHIAVHVQELEESRIQAEADRLAAALQSLTEPNTPDKTHYMEKVSPYFLPLASQDDMHQLFEKVRNQVKRPIYIAPVEGASGQYFFMRREERTQEQPSKPSIKEQLAARSVPGDQPAAKTKNREVR